MVVGEQRLLQILDATRRPGRCRDCGKPIEWAVTAPKGKYVPLDPNPLVLRYVRNQGGVKFLVISASNRHAATCRKRREPERRPRMFGGSSRP